MEFRKIVPEDKIQYEEIYKYKYRIASDVSFVTAYSWAESYDTTICIDDGVICLKAKSDSAEPYFMMPVGPGDREGFVKNLYNYCKKNGLHFSLHWLLEEDVTFVQNILGDCVKITPSRNSAEYIYLTSALLTLSGKKLHAKRNFVNSFKAKYKYDYFAIDKGNIKAAEEFVIKNSKSSDESTAMKRLFSIYPSSLSGLILIVDNEIIGVTIGEKITDDTALIHLEKGNTNYVGVYPFINQLFVQTCFSDTIYINREEDMGIEGLRKAKLSYNPAFLLEKFTATEVL